MKQASILVLAAGMGSRYGGLKQLESVGPNNETLLDYSVYDAIQAGFQRIVFIIRRDIENAFRETIGKRYDGRIEIGYAFQELDDLPAGFSCGSRKKPWGTAHALYAARHSVNGNFAVINADDFYGREAYTTLANHFRQSDIAGEETIAMVGYPLENTLSHHGSVNRGLCKSLDGNLQSVEEITGISVDASGVVRGLNSAGEKIHPDPKALVSMNFWGFSDSIFPQLEKHLLAFLDSNSASETAEFYIPTFVDDLIHKENARCSMLTTTSDWFGVTYPDDLAAVKDKISKLIRQQVYPSPLED